MKKEYTTKELMEIALKYIEKSYDYEQLMYGDDLYYATHDEKEKCGEYWEEAMEIGTKAFRQKILQYTSND